MDLFQIAEQIENETAEPSANETEEYVSEKLNDLNAPQVMRSIEVELRLSERAVTDHSLGKPGSILMARRHHAKTLAEIAQQSETQARARDEIAQDRRLSDFGRQERLDALAKQHAAERTEPLAKANEWSEQLLTARESKLRDELSTPSKKTDTDPVTAALARIEKFEHARLYLDQLRRMKPGEANRAVVELVTRDPAAAPNVVRAMAILHVNDEAHAAQLAGFLAASAKERREARVRKVFSDPRSPKARAAVELALLRRTREQIQIHREAIAKDGSAAAALLANFKPEDL